jgi:hypothetical protein
VKLRIEVRVMRSLLNDLASSSKGVPRYVWGLHLGFSRRLVAFVRNRLRDFVVEEGDGWFIAEEVGSAEEIAEQKLKLESFFYGAVGSSEELMREIERARKSRYFEVVRARTRVAWTYVKGKIMSEKTIMGVLNLSAVSVEWVVVDDNA